MSNENYDGYAPHRGNPERIAQIDANLSRAPTHQSVSWSDRLANLQEGYREQWREQPFNFGCMHFAVAISGAMALFALFILPPAF